MNQIPQYVVIKPIEAKAVFTSKIILKHKPNEADIMDNRKHFNINTIYNKKLIIAL